MAHVVFQRADLPPITHDIMLKAARGEITPRVPVWAMRQAGRYLPEFLETRKTADFFTMCQTPAISCDVTLQPLRRFVDLLDGVVIFSDILIIPQAMGMEVLMEAGRGPVLTAPLNEPADLDKLVLTPDVGSVLGYLFEAITLTRRTAAEIKAVPVIGFAGGPWTLMSYMIEGGGSKTFEKSKIWLVRVSILGGAARCLAASILEGLERCSRHVSTFRPSQISAPTLRVLQHREASHRLLGAISDVAIELLVRQWEAGASLLQVFESHCGELSPAQFGEFGLPYLRRIAAGVRARVPPVSEGGPVLLVFPRNGHYALEALAADDQRPSAVGGGWGYDAISLDWGLDPADAARRVATRCVFVHCGVPSKLPSSAR